MFKDKEIRGELEELRETGVRMQNLVPGLFRVKAAQYDILAEIL